MIVDDQAVIRRMLRAVFEALEQDAGRVDKAS